MIYSLRPLPALRTLRWLFPALRIASCSVETGADAFALTDLPPALGQRYNAANGGLVGIYQQYAQVYDRSGQLAFGLRMIPYLKDLLKRHPVAGPEVVELACGTGTVAVALARAGWQVTAVDLSAEMLAQARLKAEQAGVEIAFGQQDMRSLVLPHPVDLITCLYDSMNYMLTSDELAQVFTRCRQALLPGGLLVFDMNTAWAFDTIWNDATYFSDTPDLSTAFVSEYDEQHQRTSVVVTCFRRTGDQYVKLQERHVEQAYPAEQIAMLLQDAGLTPEASYQCFGFCPPDEETSRIMWVARKGKRSR
jgi:ubiquinone/menaquinone biosynthesis C-methylase UbiE